jgi:hypothetical protein
MEKGNGVPVTRSYLYLFFSHRHVVLSRVTQQNRQKLSECSNPFQILYALPSLFGRIYPTKLDFFIKFQRLGSQPRSNISEPHQIYPTSWIYPASIGFQSHGSCPGWTYPTYQIYPSLVGFQYRVTTFDRIYLSHIRYIRPSRSWVNLNSLSDISDLSRIYPMFWHIQR